MTTIRAFVRAARAVLLVICAGGMFAAALSAQTDHDQHQHEPASQQQAPAQTMALEIPHARESSGTAWLPDASPMYAMHWQSGEWEVMAHGNVFLQYLSDGGDRGHEQFGSVNWAMGMARRPLGRGRLGLRGMVSVEPWTVNGCGYPDLLASGEVCDGRAIVDLQHPHDLSMELSVQYEQPINESLGFEVYGGFAGEPALGPVAFPHRISAMPNPLAPISHHWMDASHITFGVLTGGLYGRRWKAETSFFNGREPDATRYNLDFGALDSFSGRLWYLPNENVALQVSAGHLEGAEESESGGPRVDVDRITGSATYHRLFRNGGSVWASTAAWGRNTESGESTNFFLAETNVTFDEQDAWFGRFEVGRKKAHDLDIDSTDMFTVAKLQAGYVRYLEAWNSLKPGLGATVSMSLVPNALESAYGNRATFGIGLFVTMRPAEVKMDSGHAGHRMP